MLPAEDTRAIRAEIAVARMVLIELERAGQLSDDRPELALRAVERWCEGEGSIVDVMEALELSSVALSAHPDAARVVMWVCRINASPQRQNEVRAAVKARAVAVLVSLGEPARDAEHRVNAVWAGA